ncbi:hypothetical protein K438DRAFT_1840629 [Mycena galopus ATCC 62051]|nr:hypothetical protein K438DRAFT_1840629 [Mycena galopus ATCC 62051]
MSMNCQFSFGPNRSYFCSAGSVFAWSQNSLPPKLAALLQGSAHPQALDTPYDVAFPMEPGMFVMCWRTKSGQDWYEDGSLGPAYARLARFVQSVATTGAHTTRTVFGPNASFFSMSPSGFCWQNLPFHLEDNIHACIKIRRPTCVGLGAQGSYIVMYNDGKIAFDLRGLYPLVESMLRNTQEAARRRGIMYVALNPFTAGEFYAVYGDGSASWNFPTAWTTDVTAISRQITAIPIPASPVVSPGGITPQVTGTPPAPAPPPVEVSLGGTGPPTVQPTDAFPTALPTAAVERSVSVSSTRSVASVPSPVLSGSTTIGIASAIEAAGYTTPSSPSPAPPAYAYTPRPRSPRTRTHPRPRSPPKINWREALSTGIKVIKAVETTAKAVQSVEGAVSGAEKLVNSFDNSGQTASNQQGQQQQQGQTSFDFNSFNQQQQYAANANTWQTTF